jgi:nitrogen fixation/metabolism regulation signal transduction histidine kinase
MVTMDRGMAYPDEQPSLNEGQRLARLVRRIIWFFIIVIVMPAALLAFVIFMALIFGVDWS